MTSSVQKSPWRQLKPKFSVFWRGSLIITIPIIFLVASMLIVAGLRSRTIKAHEEEKQERRVLTLTQEMLQDLVDAQTGIRGYALTGEPELLQAYQDARGELPETLDQLETALADDPDQLSQFRELEPLVNQKLEQLGEKLTIIQQLDPPLVQTPQLTQQLLESNETMEQLRDRVAVFLGDERRLSAEREALVVQWRDLTTNVQWLVLIISLMAGVAAIYLFYLLDKELSERSARLQETNLRLEAVFDSFVDGIIILDTHGQIESCNQSAAQIFGYDLEEMPGLSFQTLVADQDFRNSQATLDYFLGIKGDKLNRFQETVGQGKSQAQFPMELGLSQLQSEEIEPHYIALVRDITERKESEAILHKQARLLDLANDSIIVRDLDDRITYWNRGAQRLFGWRTEEALGKTIDELLHTQFPDPRVQTDYLAAGDWKGELIQTNKQGQSMIVLSSWTLQMDDQGRPLSHLQIDKDITEAKKAELALRHREEMYRTLVENFPNGAVFLFDHHLRYTLAAGTDVSQASVLSSQHDLVGKTLEEAMVPEIAAQLKPLYQAALAGKANMTEINDRDHVYRVHVLPITQEDETVLAGMVMTQDITDSKQYEDNLRARAEELARTTGILAHTTKILESRNKELDQFAYIVSHDLKAPLRAIANLSSWIEEDLEERLDQDTRHQMDLLRGRVHRMESLIEGLLQYSRVGRIETSVTMVNLRGLLNEVIDSVAPPEQFTIELPETMPTFATEVLPLQQVFANLISNAVKHNDQEQGKVEIGMEDLGEAYEFSVRDNGPGIDPKYHDRIFVMFQTLQPRDKVENTGVGLAIVKKIIEDKGGTLRVESEEGKGTTIYFTWLK